MQAGGVQGEASSDGLARVRDAGEGGEEADQHLDRAGREIVEI